MGHMHRHLTAHHFQAPEVIATMETMAMSTHIPKLYIILDDSAIPTVGRSEALVIIVQHQIVLM